MSLIYCIHKHLNITKRRFLLNSIYSKWVTDDTTSTVITYEINFVYLRISYLLIESSTCREYISRKCISRNYLILFRFIAFSTITVTVLVIFYMPLEHATFATVLFPEGVPTDLKVSSGSKKLFLLVSKQLHNKKLILIYNRLG